MKALPTVVEIVLESGGDIDGSRLSEIVEAMIERDARATATHDVELGQIVLRAADEKHLLALVTVLSAKVGDKLVAGSPQVTYREAFSDATEADYTHKMHLGPTYQFGRVIIRFEPAQGRGIGFVNAIKPGDLPFDYISAVEQGILEAAATGFLIGAPLTDFTATLVGAAYHDIDSSVRAFKMAARGAIKEAAATAGIKILEPVMQIAVLTRPQWRKVVENHLVRRRAALLESNDPTIVVATAPMAALFGVENDLIEIADGEAAVAMIFDSYGDVPPSTFNPDDTLPAAAALRA